MMASMCYRFYIRLHQVLEGGLVGVALDSDDGDLDVERQVFLVLDGERSQLLVLERKGRELGELFGLALDAEDAVDAFEVFGELMLEGRAGFDQLTTGCPEIEKN